MMVKFQLHPKDDDVLRDLHSVALWILLLLFIAVVELGAVLVLVLWAQ